MNDPVVLYLEIAKYVFYKLVFTGISVSISAKIIYSLLYFLKLCYVISTSNKILCKITLSVYHRAYCFISKEAAKSLFYGSNLFHQCNLLSKQEALGYRPMLLSIHISL